MRALLTAGLAVALGACAHAPPADDGLDFAARRERLEATEAWEMRGRIAVEAGDEAHLARFRWVQDGAALRLNVRGPFGAGSFAIEGTPPELTVTTRGETWRLENAESELSAWFGWWLPVESLSAWLLGMPDPEFPSSARVAGKDRLASFDQRRWRVRFDEYMLAADLLIPEEMTFRHRDLSIELTVDEWTPGSVSLN